VLALQLTLWVETLRKPKRAWASASAVLLAQTVLAVVLPELHIVMAVTTLVLVAVVAVAVLQQEVEVGMLPVAVIVGLAVVLPTAVFPHSLLVVWAI
jgi:hypothetical protein